MKKTSKISLHLPLLTTLAVVLLAIHAQGQALYWDINGSTAGAGGTAPAGLWDVSAQNWNNAAGDGAATSWANTGLGRAFFAAGSDATGGYTVTLGGGSPLKLAALTLNAGTLLLTPQTAGDGLDFGTTSAALSVAGGASLTIAASVNGANGLTKSGTGTAILAGANSIVGAYVIQAGELQLADGVTAFASTLTIGGTAGVGATLTLGSTAVLNLGGTLTFANANTPLAGTIQGGTLNLNGSRTFTIQNSSAADPDLTIHSVIADGSTASDLIKGGGGSLTLTGANTYTGSTTINGTLSVQGDNASIASSSSITINAAATANFGSTGTAVAVNRIGDTAAVTLAAGATGGASLNYIGADSVSQSVHAETAGVLTFAGDHRSVVTLTPGAGDELTLTFASLARQGYAVGLVRGAALGSALGTADSTRVFFDSPPVLTGNIIPWLLGDTAATGNGVGFVTYGSNGLRLLTAGEYSTPAAATTGANVLKSTNGAAAINSSVVVNSWTSTGSTANNVTTLASGVTLGIASGAMLFTANGTITGGTIALAASSEGIVHIASGANTTFTINSVITGGYGLTLNGAGTGNKILALGGDNAFTGGVRVFGGVLSLNHAGAINATGVNTLAVQTGTVRLNGYQVTVAGLDGDGAVQNFSTTSTAALRVNGAGTFTGVLSNGTGAAALSLTKAGTAVLTLQGNNTFTGETVVEQGVLQLSGASGRLSGTTAITVKQGATLRVTNGNVNNLHADRVNDAAVITLAGGTLDFSNGTAAVHYSESTGVVALAVGANLIIADQSAADYTSTQTLASLSRQTGATLNITGSGTGLGASTRNRLDIGGLNAGFIGGWATVGNDFAKYIIDIDGLTAGNQGSVAAFVASDYSTLGQADWTNALYVKPTEDQTLTASRETATINLTQGIDLALGGNTLTIASGGLIKQGAAVGNNGVANRSQITNGTLTAGTTAGAELFVRVTGANLNVSAVIADNSAGTVHVVKSGAGTLFLNAANTYTGSTYINEGVVTVGNGGNGSSATQAGATGRTGSGYTSINGTAVLTGTGLVQGSLGLHGGTLRPGDAAGEGNGTLWVGGDLEFHSGTIAMQITAPTVNVAGLINSGDAGYAAALAALPSNPALTAAISSSQHDHLEVVGTFDWGAGLGLVTVLNNGYTPVAGDVFNLIDWGQVNLAGMVDVSQDLATFDLGVSGLGWDTSLWASHGVVIVTQVPEPARALLLLAGVATVALRRRRRF